MNTSLMEDMMRELLRLSRENRALQDDVVKLRKQVERLQNILCRHEYGFRPDNMT